MPPTSRPRSERSTTAPSSPAPRAMGGTKRRWRRCWSDRDHASRTGMMFVLTVAISRAVPLLFLFSALLVLGRFLYDRYRPGNPAAATTVFLAVPMLGLLAVGPYILRSGALVLAELSVSLEKWENVDRFYALHYRLGGRPALRLHYNWVSALMNLERWPQAEEKLLLTVRKEGDRAI